jgi:hemerythrin
MRPPAPAEPAAPRSAAKNQIDDEHRQLNELLSSLTATHDLERIQAMLSELATLLRRHFETEEGPQGLHEVVGEEATHRLTTLQRLIDEHAEILVRVEQLRIEVADCLDGPVRRTVEGVAALADLLHRHEADEEELFGEAFYSDIGGRGD